MEKNTTKVLPKTDAPPPDNGVGSHHEEKPSSSVPPGKILENCNEKLSHNTEKETCAVGSDVVPSKNEPDVTTEEDEEEFILRLHSSDEETFEDAIELGGDVKKPTTVEMPEKYFSDIESSDDSEVYEPKSPPVVDGPREDLVADPVETEGMVSNVKEKMSCEVVRAIELEFEPVESDEEDFEESPSLETLAALPSEVENLSDEIEEGRIRTTPLYDEDELIANEKDIDEKEHNDEEALDQEQKVVQEKENLGDKEKEEEVDQLQLFAETENDVDNEKKVDQVKTAIDEAVEKDLKLLSSPVSSQASDFEEADAAAVPPGEIDCAPIEIGRDTLTVPDILKFVEEVPVSNTLAKTENHMDGGDKNIKIVTTAKEKQEDSEAEAKVSAKRKALLDDWEDELSNSPKRNKDDDFLAVITEELNELPEELGLNIEDEISHEQQECTSESVEADIETQDTPVKEDECVKAGVESKSPSHEVEDTEKLSEEQTGAEDPIVFDIETGAETEVETVAESSAADKQVEKETDSEESVHTDRETSSEAEVITAIPDESEEIVEETADSEKIKETSENSSDKELNKSVSTDNEKPRTVTEESEDHPVVKDESIKEAEDCLENPEDSSVKVDDEPNESPNSSDAAETLEPIDKANEAVENPCAVDVLQEQEPSQENTPIEKSEESLPTEIADKTTDDLTEKRQCLEIDEKAVSNEGDPVELAASAEKVSDVAEKSEERTDVATDDAELQKDVELQKDAEPQKDAESQKTAELTENNEKSGCTDPDEPLKSDKQAVDSLVKESLSEDKTEISDALKKTDEPNRTDTTEAATDALKKTDEPNRTDTTEAATDALRKTDEPNRTDTTEVATDALRKTDEPNRTDTTEAATDALKKTDEPNRTDTTEAATDALRKTDEPNRTDTTEVATDALRKTDEPNRTDTTEVATDALRKTDEPNRTDTTEVATDALRKTDEPNRTDTTEVATDALRKTDEPNRTDTTEVPSDVTVKSEPVAASSTTEPVKNKSSEPETIEIDDDDIAGKESDKKQVDIQINEEKAKSKEENLNEEGIAAGDLNKEDAGTSKKSIQSKEDKQQLETVTDMETEAASIAKPSEVDDKTSTPTTPEETTRKDDDVEMLEIIDTEEPPNGPSKSSEDQSSKDDTTMKPSESVSVQDDEEPLLMIDTAHKEDNEYNDIDTETEQTATSAQTTDSSSDGSLEIFYDKECLNYDCKHTSKNFYRATLFSLNYYKISKKRSKAQFACEECYDRALDSYEEMCRTLKQKQPLLHGATFKAQEYVEIIDSSDEEESDGTAEKFKDENALPKESIELLEAELEGAIRKVMHNVEIQNQLSWTKQILQQRLNNLEEDAEYVSEQLRVLQKKTDNMHNSLYQCPKIKIRQLTPLDLNSGRTYYPETETTIPPVGEILRASIYLNETYYAVKNKAIASWVPCKVIEAIDGYLPHSKNLKHYKIKFLKSKYPMLKTVSAKHMAFFNPPKVRLPIGTRVIAYFDATSLSRGKEKMQIPSAFYPGIIAEPLKQNNKFRYLVFYDDGYFQYVYHKDVRLVCSASEQVWEDVHHQSREFIHNYLTQYAVNRPMVQTQKGQSMLVDYNGKWIYARVIDVDCSLVQMLYEGQSRSEWIYRGSTRLGPVYKESNNLVKNQWGQSRLSRRTEPFIRYFNGDDSSSSSSQQIQEPQQPKPGEVRSVAKKSVSRTDTSHSSQPVPAVRHLNNSTIFVDDDNKPKGKVVYYTARKNLPPRDYVSHICSPSCPFTITHNLLYYSPLAKPLLSGWERQVFRQKSKKFIVYRGPCGKRMRSMEELHRYLRVTENDLNVDNFDFSPETNCLAEYVIESCIVQKKDISNGKEKMPIPCVNYYDNTMPPDCVYSSRRIPTEGVPLNLNKEFLVGCDCEDDCSDKSKCSCWELTYAGAKYGMPNVPNEMVGYQYKRLYEHVPTGIYECNSRCKCKANCINRVVQQPLQSKLQVFKTSNRGWGLRCINDVPRGSFICIYAGHLLTEQKANEGGLDAGDEYFAELDYIEVAEQIKEGYESDVVEPDEDEELYNPEKEDDDDDEFVAPSELHRNKAFNTRLRARRSTKNSTDAEHDSQERQVISFEPNKLMGQPDHSSSEKQTIRKLFGKDEACYIMDAKITGNLGRYFNHSCSPNLFVQNVFVDTHDLRFPWVAFFAFTHIRAGTELTWNYNYEVGVVPGKVLYCQCGAPNCRQRLL